MPFAARHTRVLSLTRSAVSCALVAMAVTGCGSTAAPAEDAVFVVVRHAEKLADGSKDPPLSQSGLARADALASQLADAPLVAAYATPYRRTRQTAAPAARDHALLVGDYDPQMPAQALATRLRTAHPRGTVLVVGHSNTAPAIAAALCRCVVAPLDDSEYGDLYRIDRNGLQHGRF